MKKGIFGMKKNRKANATKSKKSLAFLLAGVLLLAMLPFTAMADVVPLNQIVSGRKITDTMNGSLPASVQYYNATGGAATETDYAVAITKSATDTVGGNLLPENQFEITLEVKTTQLEMTAPADAAVALIIDISGSMRYVIGSSVDGDGYDTTSPDMAGNTRFVGSSRMAAAKNNALDFLDSYVSDLAGIPEANRPHRYISVISFSSGASVVRRWVDASKAAGMADIKNSIYGLTAEGGTNLEAGLILARNLFRNPSAGGAADEKAPVGNDGNAIRNRFVLLLTDGNPTFHTNGLSGQTGIGNITTNAENGTESDATVAPCRERATPVANQIKNGGLVSGVDMLSAKMYTVALSTSQEAFRINTTSATTMTAANWLSGYIAYDPSYAIAVNDQVALANAFSNINEQILRSTRAWRVYDSMGANIVLDASNGLSGTEKAVSNGASGNNYLTYDSSKDEIEWDLVKSDPVLTEPGTRTLYTYRYSYRITLDNNTSDYPWAANEAGLNTNTEATLVYYITDNDVRLTNDNITVAYNSPKVRAFRAGFEFFKTDHSGNALSGAEFTLYIDGNTNAYKTAVSAVNTGLVDFGNLPSGHKYVLRETAAPANPGGIEFVIDGTVYNLSVDYGKLTGATGGMFSESNGVLSFKNYPTRYDVTVDKETASNAVDYKDGKADYTVRITNNESIPVKITKITDTFDPAMLQYVKNFGDVSAKLDGVDYSLGGAGFSGGVLEIISDIMIPAGKSLVITYTVYFNDYVVPGSSSNLSMRVYDNNVVVMVDGFDPHEGGTTIRQHGRGYSVTKEIETISGLAAAYPYTAQPGDEVVYKVTIYNRSTSGAGSMAVTKEMLNDSFTFSGDPGLNVAGPFVPGNTGSGWGYVPFNGTTLTSGTSAEVYYTFTIPNDDSAYGKTLNNTVVFDPGDGPTPPGDTPEIPISGTKLVMSKEIVGGNNSPYASGDEIAFQVTVENVGDVAANNVRFSDMLSGGGAGIQAPEYKAIKITLDNGSEVDYTGNWSGALAHTFNVGAYKTVTLSYIVKVYGPEELTAVDVEALSVAVEEAEAAFHDMLDEVKGDYNDAADAYEQALAALDYAYQALDDAVAAADPDDPEPADYSEYYEAIEEAQAEVDACLAAMNEAAELLDEADVENTAEYIALMAAIKAYNDAVEIVNDSSLTVQYSNSATVTGGGNWPAATAGFEVGLQRIKGLSVYKEVKVGDGDYEKIASAPYEGANVSYRITVRNDGNTDLEDVKVYDTFNGAGATLIDEIAVLNAGETVVYYIDEGGNVTKDGAAVATIPGYDAFTNNTGRILPVSNTASVTVGGEDGPGSTTVVNVNPKPVAKLDVIKYVRGSADPGNDSGWARGYTTYTNGAAAVDFKIVVRNYGNVAATVTLDDLLIISGGESSGSFNKVITVEPGEANKVIETIYGVTLNSGEWAMNTATLIADGDTEIINGESIATAEVRPIPHSVMSVRKQVWDGENWVTSASFQSATAKEVIFRITVINEGEAAGTFMLEDIFDGIDITGELNIKVDGEDVPAFASGYYNATGQYFTVPGDGSVEFYYTASVYGQKSNAARIWIIGDDEETTGENEPYNTIEDEDDEASVIVTSRPIISISKYVAQGAYDAGSDNAGVAWSDRLSVTTSPLTVTYKIVARVEGMNPSGQITVNVNDSMLIEGGESLPAFEFNTDGQQSYYYTRTHSAIGSYSNTAWIESVETNDGDADPEISSDTPTTNVTINPPPSQPYTPPPYTPAGPTERDPTIWNERTDELTPANPPQAAPQAQEEVLMLPNQEVPLGELPDIPADENSAEPELEFELENPDVPLGNLPQTGLLTMYNIAFLLGVALIITGAVQLISQKVTKKSKR